MTDHMPPTRWPPGRDVLSRPAVVYVGIALIVLGLIAIVLGWYGVGSEKVVERQIPYLVSGGFGGGGLIAVGVFMLFVNELRVLRQRVDDLHAVMRELDTEVVQRIDHVLADLGRAENGSTSERSQARGRAAKRA